jgi:hypothetical protein
MRSAVAPCATVHKAAPTRLAPLGIHTYCVALQGEATPYDDCHGGAYFRGQRRGAEGTSNAGPRSERARFIDEAVVLRRSIASGATSRTVVAPMVTSDPDRHHIGHDQRSNKLSCLYSPQHCKRRTLARHGTVRHNEKCYGCDDDVR